MVFWLIFVAFLVLLASWLAPAETLKGNFWQRNDVCIAVLIVFVAVTTSGSMAAEDTGTLIDKVVSAYGGRERLESLATVRESGRVQAASGMSGSGPLLRVFQAPSTLRVEVGSPPETEVRILVDQKAWRNGRPTANSAMVDALVLQALRLDLPHQLLLHRMEVTELKPVTYEGKRLRVLELLLKHGISVTAGVEPDTGRILFSRGLSANLPNGPMSFETRYEDFRQVKGYLFAFKEVNLAGGFKTADTVLTNVVVSETVKTGR